jgi:hypothetical protein
MFICLFVAVKLPALATEVEAAVQDSPLITG